MSGTERSLFRNKFVTWGCGAVFSVLRAESESK